MFERYTEKARRVIFFARYEASSFGSAYIETEHLLLGLLREHKGIGRLLPKVDYDSIRQEVAAHTVIKEASPTSVDLPLSDESKRVLVYAAEEADRLSHRHIGTEHLLLGLLREKEHPAAQLLIQRGADLDKLRGAMAGIAGEHRLHTECSSSALAIPRDQRTPADYPRSRSRFGIDPRPGLPLSRAFLALDQADLDSA